MKLEMTDFPVKKIKLGKQTGYNNGTLTINKQEILDLILQDKRIVSADLDLAFPGERTRIANVRDVVEPRIKISGPGADFPGILGSSDTTGEGRTNKLSGMAVVASATYTPTILRGLTAPTNGLVDMWGPGAKVAPYGILNNVVLILKLVDPITEIEAHEAIIGAELKTAVRLAETTKGKEPKSVETFELAAADSSLPRVVYICTAACDAYSPHSGVGFYGLSVKDSFPTLVHPNEFLDGAITSDARRGMGTRITTYQWQNQPVILQLLRDHGKRLNFLGVILERTEIASLLGKRVQAARAAQMAKLVHADGAIITKTTTSGNGFIEVMLTVHECEVKGVKTVLITAEYGGKDGTELPLVYYAAEANAMVSLGSFERGVPIGVPDKVIGVEPGELTSLNPTDPPFSPWSELVVENYNMTSGIDWFGETYATCKQY